MNNKPFNLDSLTVCKDLQLESLLDYKDSVLNDADKLLIEQHIAGCDSCSKTLMDIEHFYGNYTTDLLDEEWEQNRSKMGIKLTFINYKTGIKESLSKASQLSLAKLQNWNNNMSQLLAKPQLITIVTCLFVMIYGLPLLLTITNNTKRLASNENQYFPPYVDIDNEAIYPDQLAYYDLQSQNETMAFRSLRYIRAK